MPNWIVRRAMQFLAWLRLLPWRLKRLIRFIWHTIPTYLPFYLLLIVLVWAAWKGWQRETVISPFYLPPEDKAKPIPFSGDTVANELRDALTSIHMEAKGQSPPPPCDVLVTSVGKAERLAAQASAQDSGASFAVTFAEPSGAFNVATRVSVEVKGISAAAVVAEAREVLGHEASISGDVLLDSSDQFRLMARENDLGPWEVGPYSLSVEGLKKASCEMAERIFRSTGENLLAAAWIHRGDYKQVIQLYDVLPIDKPDLADALNNLGFAMRETYKIDDSIVKFNQALTLKPKFPEAHTNLGIALYDKRRYDEAIAEFRRVLELQPGSALAHNNLGIALEQKGQVDEAIVEFRTAFTLRQDYAEAHNNLGIALDEKGQVDEAIAEFRAAFTHRQDYAQAHNNLGNALKEKGLYDEAIAEYRKALALKPDYPGAHNNLGFALDEKGQVDEAIVELKKALLFAVRSLLTNT